MNKHIFLDNVTANIGALISGRKKFFAESSDSRTFEELIRSTELSAPEINSEGTFEIEATTSDSGTSDPAFRVEKWLGDDYPTIIYHHGNNERPFDYRKRAKNSFFNIFVKARDQIEANLIVVRAPFHNGTLKECQKKMLRLENFMAMLSVSATLNESIIAALRKKGNAVIITCGLSLGGWVTNLHRSYYNSSTAYVPLMAGTFLGELFIKSKYRKLASEHALQFSDTLRQLLNYHDDFSKVTTKNAFPLLAIYDQYIEYDVQKQSYEGHPIEAIEAGHVTGSLNTDALRDHILTCIINAFNSGQMQGAGSRRHSILFQGFRNEADGLK